MRPSCPGLMCSAKSTLTLRRRWVITFHMKNGVITYPPQSQLTHVKYRPSGLYSSNGHWDTWYIIIMGRAMGTVLLVNMPQHAGSKSELKYCWTHWLPNVTTFTTRSPVYWHSLTLIPAWISYYIPGKMWDEITHPFLNFNGCTDEV